MAGAGCRGVAGSGKRRLALEIFPVRPDAAQRYPRLKPYWKSQEPPAPGLSALRWGFRLPPVVSIAREIGRGAQTFQPAMERARLVVGFAGSGVG
ncbi:MAG TPA: hypothetical protein VFE14_16060 [Micromonosporaceae bacterium]|nr:hypothetical protein [Micromonosporaceae bacterium]